MPHAAVLLRKKSRNSSDTCVRYVRQPDFKPYSTDRQAATVVSVEEGHMLVQRDLAETTYCAVNYSYKKKCQQRGYPIHHVGKEYVRYIHIYILYILQQYYTASTTLSSYSCSAAAAGVNGVSMCCRLQLEVYGALVTLVLQKKSMMPVMPVMLVI